MTQNKKSKAVGLGIVILAVSDLLYYSSRPSEIIINKDSILSTGMYGFELPVKDILEIKLIKKLPTITSRTNGLSFGSIKKGYFSLEDYGKCRLFLQSDSKPYLMIAEKNGEKTIINFRNQKEIERLKFLITNN